MSIELGPTPLTPLQQENEAVEKIEPQYPASAFLPRASDGTQLSLGPNQQEDLEVNKTPEGEAKPVG